MPYFIFIVNNPCCPNNISFTNVNSPNQTTGVISTPNAGGTDPRANLRSGSVGHTTMLNGKSLTLADGYHERTMRHSMANENKFKKGPSTNESGSTQASVSDRIIDEDAIIASEVKASNPTPTFVVVATRSATASTTGDACKAEFLMENVVEVADGRVGIARALFCTGANAMHDWVAAASTVTILSRTAMVMLGLILVLLGL
mmetsp:Transcript_28512/g.59423  ORF Transcript_28512/g.59423 Transcript_28512/m.59423 type:complete len:202 (+) Transcript_28512:272-877(+)